MPPKPTLSATAEKVKRCWEWGNTAHPHRRGRLCMNPEHAYLFHHVEKRVCIQFHAYVLTQWFSTYVVVEV